MALQGKIKKSKQRMKGLSKYLRVSKNVMQTLSAYKLEFLMDIISQPLYLVISFFLWKNIFEFGGYQNIVGYTFKEMIAYLAFQISFGGIIISHVDFRISEEVNSGEIIIPLTRPFKYMLNHLAIEFGITSFFILLVDLPVMLISILFFFMAPKNLAYFLLSMTVVLLGSLLYFMFSFCFGLISCWIKKYGGLGRLKTGIIDVLSGKYIPLNFFPAPVLAVLNFLPFSYLAFAPANIFLGKISYLESLCVIIMEAIWIAFFYVIYRIIWKYAKKQITGEGV